MFSSPQIHHFLDFVKQIYKDLPKVVVSSTSTGGGFAVRVDVVFDSDLITFLLEALTCHCLLVSSHCLFLLPPGPVL